MTTIGGADDCLSPVDVLSKSRRGIGQTLDKAPHTFIFTTRSHTLVDVEEHGECAVSGPALADDGIDAFA